MWVKSQNGKILANIEAFTISDITEDGGASVYGDDMQIGSYTNNHAYDVLSLIFGQLAKGTKCTRTNGDITLESDYVFQMPKDKDVEMLKEKALKSKKKSEESKSKTKKHNNFMPYNKNYYGGKTYVR